MKSKYDPLLYLMPETENRKEISFRVAGDGFLQAKYGKTKSSTGMTLKDIILNAVRVIIVNRKVKEAGIKDLIETVPGNESILYLFDTLEIDSKKLVDDIVQIESEIKSIKDEKIETRIVRLPLVFDDSLTRKAIEKYCKEIKPGAINCENNSNLKYIAKYNGITVEELKQKFIKTEWLVSMVGFFPGLPFYLPLDPTCAITAPKYNPARTWTAEGAVDLADYCSTIFGVESSGGYQLVGRTAPIFQAEQKHPQFKESPVLFKPTDIIKYYEVTEEELLAIHKLVHNGCKWEYDIKKRIFSLKEWLKFYDSQKDEIEDFTKRQEKGRKITLLP